MREALGPGTILGYCTNVHPGATLEAIRANLLAHAVPVRAHLVETGIVRGALGIGLWLPAATARALVAPGQARTFGAWLAEHELEVFTINGFPFGDFHGPVVKHRVYEPAWTTAARLEYTLDLVRVLAILRGRGAEGSISTLPLGWGATITDHGRHACAEALRTVAAACAEAEDHTGCLVHVDLEPEPGCALQRSDDVVRFFEGHLLPGADDEDAIRRHLRVCHDVCHAAVMFEAQDDVLDRYEAAGIAVGKVQVSSAVRARFEGRDGAARARLHDALRAFGEERYLHQVVRRAPDGRTVFHEDLPAALAAVPAGSARGEWRVHFHVPVFLEHLAVPGAGDGGGLVTTREDVHACLRRLRGRGVRHFEVETYAWDVLPAPMRAADLAGGIARELRWTAEAGAA